MSAGCAGGGGAVGGCGSGGCRVVVSGEKATFGGCLGEGRDGVRDPAASADVEAVGFFGDGATGVGTVVTPRRASVWRCWRRILAGLGSGMTDAEYRALEWLGLDKSEKSEFRACFGDRVCFVDGNGGSSDAIPASARSRPMNFE